MEIFSLIVISIWILKGSKIFKKERSALYTCTDSPIDLRLGFSPGFNAIKYSSRKKTYTGKDVVPCPLYDLMFRHIEPNPTDEQPWAVQPTPMILQAALKHFFVYQQDMDAGTLKVAGFKGKERVIEDLPLLERYLTKGTIVEARTDFGGGVGQAKYRI